MGLPRPPNSRRSPQSPVTQVKRGASLDAARAGPDAARSVVGRGWEGFVGQCLKAEPLRPGQGPTRVRGGSGLEVDVSRLKVAEFAPDCHSPYF